jgi:hypothetical protein
VTLAVPFWLTPLQAFALVISLRLKLRQLQCQFLIPRITFGVVYPSYWLQPKLEMRFSTHLVILKVAFCQPKKVGLNEVWVPTLFSSIAFDLQRFLFVFTMKNNAKLIMQKPFDLNPLTKLWKTLSSSQILEHQSPKYIKLIELVVCAIYWFNRG